MGTSHVDSNMEAKDGTETISGFASIGGTTITATGAVSGANVQATNYIKIGTHKYIINTAYATEASIVAEATSIEASVKGSIALGVGKLWVFDTDTDATLL